MERESEKDSNPRSGFRGKDESLFNFEGPELSREIWGYSSAGRAPALQAGGQEFDPPHLHQKGRIAQVVRAHA